MKNCHPCESSKTKCSEAEYFYLGQETNGRLYDVSFYFYCMLAYVRQSISLSSLFFLCISAIFSFWVATIQRRKAMTEEVDQIHCCDQMITLPYVTFIFKKIPTQINST